MTTDTATDNNVKIENASSNAALALKGISTRATHLKVGTAYIMRAWHKEPVFSEVVFVGFGKSIDTLVETIPQLKSLTNEDKFFFTSGGETVTAHGQTACVFVGEGDAAVRATFFALLGAEPEVKVEVPVPVKAKRTRKAKVVETPVAATETPAETVEIEAPAEAELVG